MFEQNSVLAAAKAVKYCDMLAKHFARKVEVEAEAERALVHFPMGKCTMVAEGEALHFCCRAESREALEVVKTIIDKHIYLLKDVRDTQLQWHS